MTELNITVCLSYGHSIVKFSATTVQPLLSATPIIRRPGIKVPIFPEGGRSMGVKQDMGRHRLYSIRKLRELSRCFTS